MKNENLENNIINNNLNNDSNEVQNLSNIIPNNNNDSIQNLSTSSSYKVIEDNNNTNDKNNNNNEKHIINNGIEIPLNPLSNSIKILKKDKHGEVLSNISYSYIFKVSLIGDSSTGKTSILLRFIDDYFTEDTKSTIGVDFKLVSFELEPKIYAKMQIWDTCGSERFKSLTSSFIKTCSAFILIFDLTRKNTFHNIDHWIKIIKENTSPKFMILIGNKSDLINERNIDKEIILDYCEKNLFNYMEISAKNNLNIEKLFKEVAYQLYNDIKKSEKNDIKNIGYKGNFSDIQVKLDDNNPSQKKGCCW
jgi:Ras-related protein Rab-11A